MPKIAQQTSKQRRSALVTGAASGIGLEFAKLLARDRYALILVDRDKAGLLHAAEQLTRELRVPIKTIVQDLAAENAAARIYADVKRLRITPDILINNAGFGAFGEFAKSDMTKNLEMIKTNVTATTAVMHAFLPDMMGRGRGRILNTASEAGFFPGPLLAVYYATKAYILSLSQAVAEELRAAESRVTVSVLCPGPVETGFVNQNDLKRSNLFRGKLLRAEEVAMAGYRGMLAGKRVIVVGRKARWEVRLSRLIPRRWVTKLVAQRQRRLY